MYPLEKKAFEPDLKGLVVFQSQNAKDKHSLKGNNSMFKGTEALKIMGTEERDGELLDVERINKTEDGKGSGGESEKVQRGQIWMLWVCRSLEWILLMKQKYNC